MISNTPPTPTTDPAQLPLAPGNDGLPIVGETLHMVVEGRSFLEKRQRLYGDVFRTHIFGRPAIYLLGPEANRWLLMNEGRDVEVYWPSTVERLLGPGSLSNLHGDEHRARRKLLAPLFSQTEMRSFVGTIEQIARAHLSRAASSSKPIIAVDVMRALTFEVAARLVLGGTESDLPALRRAFEDFAGGLFTPIRWPLPFTAFRKALAARATMNQILDRIIDMRLKDEKTHCDVLAALLSVRDESGNALARDVIRDELTTLLFAGHETTVNVMTNVLVLLAKNASVVARGRQEVAKLSLDEPLTLETLRQIPYVQRILQETMRVLPPVGGVFRQALRDTSFGGYRIPKGSMIACSIVATHHAEKSYEYADRFDPDRFDREKSNEKRDFAFIPFGGGLRICIGQHLAMVEMQIVLTHLLRSYDWSLVPNQDLTYRVIPTPLPKSGGLISLWKR